MSRTLLCGTVVALTFFLVFCVVSAEHVPLSFVRLRIIKCGVFEERHYSFVVCVVAYKFYDEMWCFCRTCSFVVCAVAYNKMWCFLQTYSFVVCVVAYKFYNEMCLGVFAEYVPLSFVQLPIIKRVFTEHIPSSSVQLPIM